jgi:hypothetical protein
LERISPQQSSCPALAAGQPENGVTKMRGYNFRTFDLQCLAHRLEEHEKTLDRLASCFDTYIEFNRDGREPSRFADGTVAMDADKSRRQLDVAIAALLGQGDPWEG